MIPCKRPDCSVEFVPSPGQEYCSHRCRATMWHRARFVRRWPQPATCHCGAPFLAINANHKSCSEACRRISWTLRSAA